MNQINEYCITITYKCNWFCDFCIIDTHNQKEIEFDRIKKLLKCIKPNSNVSITGGEPGLADKKIVEYVIKELEKLKSKININTNGLFLHKYKEYLKKIDSIYYHCSENLNNYVNPVIDDNVKDIEYMIVVSDNNIHNLDNFLDINSDKLIRVTGADNILNKVVLSKKNILKTYNIIKSKPNVNKTDLKKLFGFSKQTNLQVLY